MIRKREQHGNNPGACSAPCPFISAGAEGRIAELESSLDDTRRRLGQERQAKDNFGDLYGATSVKEVLSSYLEVAG